MRRPPLPLEQRDPSDWAYQKHEKERGVEKLLDFSDKVKEFIDSPEKILSILQLSPEEVLSSLERINGLLLHKPMSKRKAFSFEGVQTLNNSGDVELTFPPNEDRMNIFTEYSTLARKLIQSDEISKDVLSMYIFNLIIYLHPFVDGNGRTARFSANMIHHCGDDEYTRIQSLHKTIEERKRLENENFHYQLNTLGYKWLLYERGIESSEGKSKIEIDNVEVFETLETSQLFFIACYDVMSQEERSLYNRSLEENVFVFKASELPKEIKDKARDSLNQARVGFIRKVLDVSLGVHQGKVDTNVTPDWLMDLFKKVIS
ncbi:MAG: Fic/DOC family [Candidatus Parcubacteria bacterium]